MLFSIKVSSSLFSVSKQLSGIAYLKKYHESKSSCLFLKIYCATHSMAYRDYTFNEIQHLHQMTSCPSKQV